MKKRMAAAALIVCLLSSCAMVSERAKMEQYARILESYETAMRTSDFHTACQFVDPGAMTRQICLKRFEGLEIVDYQVNHVAVSADLARVDQEVKVDYYHLNNYVLKTITYRQTWKCLASSEKWRLQTGPPQFE